MDRAKCISCSEYKNCKDSLASWLFFIIGLVATVAIRVVTVLLNVSPVYAKVAWYVGVGGFFIFFVYKFKVNHARSRMINQRSLLDKLNRQEQLSEGDYKLMSAILCGLSSRKERINYLFIFGLSAVALILALYFDLR